MSSWRDPERWAKWVRGEDCPICRHVEEGIDVAVAELEVSRVMMPEDAPMRGYAWMPFRRHVVELHELTDEEGAAFMRDIRRVSRALAAVTGAVKLNYEIHGNTVPHLHLHLFPRYVGDPFEGGPIDARSVRGPVYGPGELEALTGRVKEELARDGAGADPSR
jgi:diadenosine tetraphosphate (Ap4A) HIT family hydrolase